VLGHPHRIIALVTRVLIGPVRLPELGRFREMPGGGFAHAFGCDGIAHELGDRQSSAWRR
jgi:hypothetical protein